MNQIINITFLEILRIRRNQFSWLLIFMTCLIVFLMDLFNYFTIEEQVKMIQDFSLGILNISLLFIAIYYPIIQIKDEFSAKTIYPLLSSPASRTDILIAKYLSVASVILMTLIINFLALTLIIFLKAKVFPVHLYKAFILLFLKHMIIAGYSFLFAILPISTIIAIICSFFIYFTGSVKSYFIYTLEKDISTAAIYIQKVVFSIIPDFRIFDVIEKITLGKHIPLNHLFFCSIHFIGVSILLILLSLFFFQKKEL